MGFKVVMALVIGLTCFAGGKVIAEETNSALEVTCSVGVFDKYLGEWTGSVFDRRTSAQGEVEVAFANGLYVDLWFTRQLGAVQDDLDGNEMDFSFGWAGEALGLDIDSAVVYYDLVPVMDGREDNVLAPYIKVSKTKAYGEDVELSPFARLEVAIPDKGSSFEGGVLSTLGVESSVSVMENASFCLANYYTRDDGVYGEDPNVIMGLAASLEFEIGGCTLVLPSFLMTQPLQDDANRETETCFGVSVSKEL